MKIEDFTGIPEVVKIFKDAAITDCASIVLYLEQYQFMTRSSIASVLSKNCRDPVLELDVLENAKDVDAGSRYHVLISEMPGKKLTVYYDYFAEPDKLGLEIEFDMFKLNYVALTPYNFRCLKDTAKSFEVWDKDLLFKRILLEAVKLKATDLHFCVEHHDLVPSYPVKYRKNGLLYHLDLFAIDAEMNHAIISSLIENKTNANSLDLSTPNGVTAMADDPLGNGKLELRISANRVEAGWHCVIRIQTKETFNFSIDSLGFSDDVQKVLFSMTKKRSGIVFITGAIRTGKNTTAFAMANEMTKAPIKLVSYEYPIEVLMPFPQVNYAGDTDVLLNNVRLAKKQDLNVAFVNELPDREVAFAVRDLVNSSVYVITTMHVDRIWHLPYKLKDYYGEDYKDVISQINAVFNQKMFSVPCKECQDKGLVSDLDAGYRKLLERHGKHTYYLNRGCSFCAGTKIQNGKNQPYVEYLVFTPEIKSKLLGCLYPYEMERVIKEEVELGKQSLEYPMCDAVEHGDLAVDALDSIL